MTRNKMVATASLCCAVSLALLSAACTAEENTPQASGSGPASAAASSTTPPRVDQASFSLLDRTRGNAPDVSAASIEAAPKPGSCGNLTDVGGSKTYQSSECEHGAYRVVQIVTMPNQCPADVDQKYYRGERLTDVFYTLCLDLAWTPNKCIKFNSISSVVNCPSSPSHQGASERVVKAFKVIAGDDPNGCGGHLSIPHKDRKFTVCLVNA